MTAISKTNKLTVEEYFALEQKSEIRHEYLNGEIFAMAGASKNHGRIVWNLVVATDSALRDKPCEGYVESAMTQLHYGKQYVYPDFVIQKKIQNLIL